MNIQNTVRSLTSLVVLALCLTGVGLAQSANKGESVAAIAADRNEVRWQPQVEYGRLDPYGFRPRRPCVSAGNLKPAPTPIVSACRPGREQPG